MPDLPIWIFGDSIDTTRQFVIHTVAPRFVAEIFEEGDDAGVLSPLSYALSDGQSLANFHWIDPAPQGEALHEILRNADRAYTDYAEVTDEWTEDEVL